MFCEYNLLHDATDKIGDPNLYKFMAEHMIQRFMTEYIKGFAKEE